MKLVERKRSSWVVGVSLMMALANGSIMADAAEQGQSNDTVGPEVLKTASPEEENQYVLATMEKMIPHRSLSLYTCFDRADKENKEILIASSALPIAQAAIVIAKAIPNPTYSMTYGWGNSYNYIVAGNGQQFGWAEDIQILGKRTKKTNVANASYIQTALQLQTVRFSVHNRVRRAYAELAAAHAYADVLDAQRDVARKLLSISQKRYDAGKAPGSEVLQAKLGFVQFDAQQNQAWGRIIQDSAQLALLLGEAPKGQEIIDAQENGLFRLSVADNVLVPDPNKGMPSLTQLLPVAWRERNDLKVAIQNAYVDKQAVTLAKTQRLPDPTVGFQYFFSEYKPFQFGFFDPQGVLPFLQGIYPNVPQLFTSFANPSPSTFLVKDLYYQSIASGAAAQTGTPIPNIEKDKVPFQPGYQLSVQHETPIFYRYQGQIDQARATWIQQLKQNDQTRAQIATDIVSAYEALSVARANLGKFQSQILPVAARVSLMAFRGYELGKTDLATAMLAQQQYQQLLSNYFDAVVAYQNAWADMEQAVGVPLNL